MMSEGEPVLLQLENESWITYEVHVGFPEGLGVEIPWATRLVKFGMVWRFSWVSEDFFS